MDQRAQLNSEQENWLNQENDRSFQRLLQSGVLVICIIWSMEELMGLVANFDRIGYSATILVVCLSYYLSRIRHKTELAKAIVFVHITVYLMSLAGLSFVLAANQGSIYPLASTLQWMPIIYIVAFLFLTKRVAIISAIGIYFLLILMLALSYTSLFPVSNTELRVLMINMALSHGLYIFCMFGIIKLKRTFKESEVRASQLEVAANIDGLLGIANRRYLQTKLDEYVASEEPVSLLIIDIDHFKSINDTYGHVVGDDVLREVSTCMQGTLRPSDIIGRWGGEEFLVLAKNTLSSGASALAERIRFGVENHRFEQVNKVTVSIGVAEYTWNTTVSHVFTEADDALYEAKKLGRNRVAVSKN